MRLGAPEPPQMNFLSGWGLGGAQPLATAKASVPLAPTVYLKTNDLFF